MRVAMFCRVAASQCGVVASTAVLEVARGSRGSVTLRACRGAAPPSFNRAAVVARIRREAAR